MEPKWMVYIVATKLQAIRVSYCAVALFDVDGWAVMAQSNNTDDDDDIGSFFHGNCSIVNIHF
jgi:hypothetical protein